MDLLNTQLNNITNKELLQINLSASALYIGMYEHFIDMVEDRVESFLNSHFETAKDGKLKAVHGEEYNRLIRDRRIDDKGNKNSLKATMLWFLDSGAITNSDYNTFLELKRNRDSYVHDMVSHILNGLGENDGKLLFDLMKLYVKIDQWWINEIEIPISMEYLPGEYDNDNVQSVAFCCFRMMFDTLFDLNKQDLANTD